MPSKKQHGPLHPAPLVQQLLPFKWYDWSKLVLKTTPESKIWKRAQTANSDVKSWSASGDPKPDISRYLRNKFVLDLANALPNRTSLVIHAVNLPKARQIRYESSPQTSETRKQRNKLPLEGKMFKNTQQKTWTLVNYETYLTQLRKTRIKTRLVTFIAQQMCLTYGRHAKKIKPVSWFTQQTSWRPAKHVTNLAPRPQKHGNYGTNLPWEAKPFRFAL